MNEEGSSPLYDRNGINLQLFRTINTIRADGYDGIMYLASILGDNDQFPIYLAVLMAFAAQALQRHPVPAATPYGKIFQTLDVPMVRVLVVFVLGFILNVMLVTAAKHWFHMPRPFLIIPAEDIRMLGEVPPEKYYQSFPSGHAAFSALLIGSLWPLMAGYWRVIGIFFVAVVAWSRIALGAHFPADELAGAGIGWAVAIAMHALLRTLLPEVLHFNAQASQTGAPPHRITYYHWGKHCSLSLREGTKVRAFTLLSSKGRESSQAALLCVHGLTRNGRDFDFLARALQRHYRVVCPDIAGRGRSEWLADPAQYQLPTYLSDLTALMAQERIERCDWVGTSMGGMLGMLMAAHYPERIRKLVLNDIGAVVPASGLARLRGYVGKCTRFESEVEARRSLREISAPFGIRRPWHWEHFFGHSLVRVKEGDIRLAYDPGIGKAFSEGDKLQDIEFWPFWEKIRCPVLILHGKDSDILTHEIAMRMQDIHPLTTIIEYEGVGHAPALMERRQIHDVRRWLLE